MTTPATGSGTPTYNSGRPESDPFRWHTRLTASPGRKLVLQGLSQLYLLCENGDEQTALERSIGILRADVAHIALERSG
jgi:hypothetical protein